MRPVFEALVTDLALPDNREPLLERALLTPLEGLQFFLAYADKTPVLKPVFKALAEDLARPDSRTQLLEQALLTPLEGLQSFLAYAGKTTKTPNLRPVFEALVTDLALPDNREPLLERALLSSSGGLQSFLAYAGKTTKTPNLRPVFEALVTDLALPDNREPLLERALLTPLEGLQFFLAYADKTPVLKPVFKALAEDLARPDSRTQLLEQALLTPLEGLQSFLAYAGKTPVLKPVFKALAEDLAHPDSRTQLLERALLTPLDHLQCFLAYAAKTTKTPNLRPVFEALVTDLVLPEYRVPLRENFFVAPLDTLVSILKSNVVVDLWNTILQEQDADEWMKFRRHRLCEIPSALGKFVQVLRQRGRLELAEGPALSLVLHSTAEQWHKPGITLRHLFYVLSFAHAASRPQIRTFLDRVATTDWVDDQLTISRKGGLAGTLLSLATMLDQHSHLYFARDALQSRIVREITHIGTQGAESQTESPSLLGSAAAMGIHIPRLDIEWPDTANLATILDLRRPDPDHLTIGHLQVQLWLGLREMARLKADPVMVSPRLADRILDLWNAAQEGETSDYALPLHVRDRNAAMIAWLQQCKAAGWHLVPPQAVPATSNTQGRT